MPERHIMEGNLLETPLPRRFGTKATPVTNARLCVAKERRRHLLRSGQYNCIQDRKENEGEQLTSSLSSVFRTLTQTSGLTWSVPILVNRAAEKTV